MLVVVGGRHHKPGPPCRGNGTLVPVLQVCNMRTDTRCVNAPAERCFGFGRSPSVSITRASLARLCMLWLLFAVGIVALPACSERAGAPRFKSTDITGSSIGVGDFTMADFTGKPRTLGEFRGKVVVLFFGFLQCPDVCPTTLAEAAAALKELGPKGEEVQVLFITVDPARDTPELLAQYVTAFHPNFLGLRGNRAELEQAAKLFKVYYAKSPSPGGGYSMDHTASLFVLDKQGRPRLLVAYGAGSTVLAHDLNQLLR